MPPVPRLITVLFLAAGLLVAGCGSDDDAVEPDADADRTDQTDRADGEAGAMSDVVDEIRRDATDVLDVPDEQISVGEVLTLADSGCRLYEAVDVESLDPFPLQYATLSDGTVVKGLTEDAVRRTLDHCFFDGGQEPDAETVAEVAIRLADAPSPIGLLPATSGPRRLEEVGVEYQPPTASGSVADGDFVVAYFARSLETNALYRGTVTRSADGAIEVDYQRL